MSALQISDKKHIANVTFKDGTSRRIDYTTSCHGGGFFSFDIDGHTKGAVVMLNADTVATLEFDNAAEMAGRA